jgi:hypothetical protein
VTDKAVAEVLNQAAARLSEAEAFAAREPVTGEYSGPQRAA